jgi:pilus assembly protein CpaB
MKRSKMILVGGAVLALLGMLLSYMYTANAAKGTAEEPGSKGATAPAYVAISDLIVGTTWEDLSTLVEKRQVPVSLRPPGAISEPSQAAGKTLVRSMSKGEILTTVQFNESGAESLKVPPGFSALTISLPLPQGVGDYVQPGSKANVFVTFKGLPGKPDPEEATVTRLLVSDVTVLANRRALSAAAQAEGAPPEGGPEVLLTLAVTIDQAERIIFAKENGAVWLTLMHAGDPAGVGLGRSFKTVLI